jgi:hypothetical protein
MFDVYPTAAARGENLMKTNRTKMLALVVVLSLAALALAPLPIHAFVCRPQNLDDVWIYYSDSTYTQVVGRCENDCGSCLCRGRQTPYSLVTTSRNC